MRQLSPMLFDYDKLWMEFQQNDSWIRLQRLTQLHYNAMRPGWDQFYQLTFEPTSTDPSPNIGSKVPVAILNEINSLL